jgi:hypothetical protein
MRYGVCSHARVVCDAPYQPRRIISAPSGSITPPATRSHPAVACID